jgi:hypothetical protein
MAYMTRKEIATSSTSSSSASTATHSSVSLPFQQVYASSTDMSPAYPSPLDLYSTSTHGQASREAMMTTSSSSRQVRGVFSGWLSGKPTKTYPQEIGFVLPARSYVKTIRIVTDRAYAPAKGTMMDLILRKSTLNIYLYVYRFNTQNVYTLILSMCCRRLEAKPLSIFRTIS